MATKVTSRVLANDSVGSTQLQDGAVIFAKLSLPANFPISMQQVVKDDTSSIRTDQQWEDIPGLSLQINRLDTTGKVRIQAVISYSSNNADVQSQFRIVRGDTAIGLGDSAGSRVRATASSAYPNSDDGQESVMMDFIDNPDATESIIYKIQIRTSSTITAYINRSYNDADTSNYTARTISTLTLTELAG